jgi:hypothetical protein
MQRQQQSPSLAACFDLGLCQSCQIIPKAYRIFQSHSIQAWNKYIINTVHECCVSLFGNLGPFVWADDRSFHLIAQLGIRFHSQRSISSIQINLMLSTKIALLYTSYVFPWSTCHRLYIQLFSSSY